MFGPPFLCAEKLNITLLEFVIFLSAEYRYKVLESSATIDRFSELYGIKFHNKSSRRNSI